MTFYVRKSINNDLRSPFKKYKNRKRAKAFARGRGLKTILKLNEYKIMGYRAITLEVI